MKGHITPPTPHIVSPSRGQIGAIAAGTHTEIVSIIAPASASPGDLVTVEVKVKNLYGDWLPILVGGSLYPDVTAIWFSPEYEWFEPGDIHPFTYSFIMPDNAVTIYVWSYYGPDGDWVDDDFGYVNIALTAVPAGELVIVRMWYEPLPQWGIVWRGEGPPPSVGPEIPLNGEIYLSPYWRNESEVNIVGHVDLEVTYPDGTKHTLSATENQDKEAAPEDGWPVQFEPFLSSQEGTYTIVVTLSSEGQVLDGVGFPLVVAAVAEYTGTISRKQLEYDEARASIPVYDIPEGQRGLVHIWGRNDTAESQRMGIYWFVADPDGMIAEEYGPAWEAWPYTGAGKEHEFIGGRFNLDREKYTMWVELLMNPDNPEVVDRYIGDLCTVVAAVPEYKGKISKKELEYDETRGIIPVY